MTTLSSIIYDAYRELNLVAIGGSLNSAQETEGLRLLNQVLKHVHEGDGGEALRDWPIGDFGRQEIDRLDITDLQLSNPPINSRIIHTAEEPFTVYLPAKLSDGSRIGIVDPFARLATYNVTFDGNGRPIRTALGDVQTEVFSVNGTSRTYMYRADLGTWVQVTDLVATDEMPYPAEFDIMFIVLLALRIGPGRHGREVAAASQAAMMQSRRLFMGRYAQSQDLVTVPDLSLDYLSTQTYDRGEEGSTREFNRGNTRGVI